MTNAGAMPPLFNRSYGYPNITLPKPLSHSALGLRQVNPIVILTFGRHHCYVSQIL